MAFELSDLVPVVIAAAIAGSIAFFTRLSKGVNKGETRDAVTATKLQEYIDRVEGMSEHVHHNSETLHDLKLDFTIIKARTEEQGRLLVKADETLQRTCSLYETVHNAHAEMMTIIAVEKIKTFQLEGQITRIWKRVDNTTELQ